MTWQSQRLSEKLVLWQQGLTTTQALLGRAISGVSLTAASASMSVSPFEAELQVFGQPLTAVPSPD
jgi:hypothetical protein